MNVSLTLGCQVARRQSCWIEGSLLCPSETSLSEAYMSNLWSKNIAVLSMQHHHSLHLPVHLDKTTTESATVGKHYDILTFIRMTRMKNHLSRSFESQSQCWWPRCLSPVDWGKRPGCPEPSDCGCELEYPLVPGGRNKRKSPHWKQNSSLYMWIYMLYCGFGACFTLSVGNTHLPLTWQRLLAP